MDSLVRLAREGLNLSSTPPTRTPVALPRPVAHPTLTTHNMAPLPPAPSLVMAGRSGGLPPVIAPSADSEEAEDGDDLLVDDPLPEGTALPAPPLPPGRAAQDLALWQHWRRDPGDHTLTPLMKQIHPVVQNEVNRWRGVLAEPLLYGRAQVLARKSLDTYDPNRGTQLATHVINGLRKLSRITYSNQNVARLSENKTLKFNVYRRAQGDLESALGRPPTTEELADELCWTPSAVTQFRTQTSRQELLEGGGHGDPEAVPSEQRAADDYLVAFIHHDLPPQQRLIFEHLTGYNGAPTLSPAKIADRLNLTAAQFAYQRRLITDRVREAQEGR